MIYNLENTIDIGRPVKRVVDANGLEWTYVLEVDTETGEIERFKTDETREYFIEDGEIATERIKTAAPIRVIFHD